MTAQGENILAWLDKAIARQEKRATLAAVSLAGSPRGGNWNQCRDEHHGGYMVRRPALRPGATTPPMTDAVPDRVAFVFGESEAAHIVANDPESVLRRCTADRKLLELHKAVPDHGRYSEPECPADCDGQHNGPPVCMACRGYAGDPLQAPCHTVLTIAEGYGWTEGER